MKGMEMGPGTKLRQVLAKNGLVEAMAAHSPLSAMLAAEAALEFEQLRPHIANGGIE